MISYATPGEAIGLARRFGLVLRTIPRPRGITADVLEGRAGWFAWSTRRLIYLKRGRVVSWYEWQRPPEQQLELPFAADDPEA